jgi:hypothetical protein
VGGAATDAAGRIRGAPGRHVLAAGMRPAAPAGG